jgi:cytochrome c
MQLIYGFASALLLTFSIYHNNKSIAVTEAPDENRFEKKVLSSDVSNPTELAVSVSGQVYFAERSGTVKIYDPVSGKTKTAGSVPTVMVAENGLIGLTLDPRFSQNGWIYLLYSREHPENKNLLLQTLSRFTIQTGVLGKASEKVLLQFSLNKWADHSAGSLHFDDKGNLYIATGDNTPFTFYAAISNKADNAYNDAQRTAANSKDLRGKILRIHPNEDGSYAIPPDNLFANDTAAGRPEIYIMGCRNPYRVTTHPVNGSLIWGEVGPDASEDDVEKGSKGFDELNYATRSGFFGWPYCIADKVYPQRRGDGTLFTPATNALENNSPNNTGLRQLPPAQTPILWYAYTQSKEFPALGFGARTIIAGAFYQYKQIAGKNAFPSYYDDAFFFGDWCRNWIMAARIKEGKVEEVRPFLSATHFDKPIDMAFGPDGALYLLEYGMGEQESKDSRLSKIIFNSGNRAPVARAEADKMSGGLPLKVQFTNHSYDLDKEDKLQYQWRFPDGSTVTTRDADYFFKKPGTYQVQLQVQDNRGLKTSTRLQITAGNHIPVVQVERANNSSFYWTGFDYKVVVDDKEDSTLIKNGMSKAALKTYYLKPGEVLDENKVVGKSALEGKKLILQNDCKSCHTPAKQLIGPAYRQVASRYSKDTGDYQKLVQKMIRGGSGVWGNRAMPPHPGLSEDDARKMVAYVLSLSTEQRGGKVLQQHGTWRPSDGSEKEGGRYVFVASYKDKGVKGLSPAVGTTSFQLRSPTVYPWEFEEVRDVKKEDKQLTNVNDGGYVQLKGINMEGVKSLTWRISEGGGGRAELRIASPDGPIVSTMNLRLSKNFDEWFKEWKEVTVPVKAVTGTHDLYFVFRNESFYYSMMNVAWVRFNDR